jgi:outer membrane protein TolC
MERMRCNTNSDRWMLARVTFAAALLLSASRLAFAQGTNATGLAPLPSPEQVIQRNTDPYAGSLPQGKATAETIDLTIEQALDMGLKYNLGLYLSDRVTDQARAARLKALSELMPTFNGSVSEELQRVNLKSFGFTFPGFPSSIGPFALFEVGATGEWNFGNLSHLDSLRAAKQNVQAAQFSYKDARDTVVLAVGANYLLTIAAESRVEAVQAEVATAQALYQLALDQENAGLAPQIDTLRARVQLQAQQQTLIQAQNDLEKQRISLARVIGLAVQQKFRLINRVPYHPVPEIDLDTAYNRALATRADYQAALASLKAAQFSRSSAWKEHLPTLGASGQYGVLGYTLSGLAPQYSVAGTLNIPIFQGEKVKADVEQADAILKQRQAQVDNLKAGIEQDVQDALLDLKAAAQQVDVATIGLDLAKQTLAQSQDRFAAGVTNNVEVIQAQQSLATANDQYIASLYEHNIAKVLLARAIGNAEQLAKQYLADTGNVATPANVNQNPPPPSPNTTPAPVPNPQAPPTPRP